MMIIFLWELGTTFFPQSHTLVNDCQFGVSPVKYSDPDSDKVLVSIYSRYRTNM